MSNTTFNKQKIEYHPFEQSFIPLNAKCLIIGSFPAVQNKRGFNFFYPNPNNQFWKVMDHIFSKSSRKFNLKISKNDILEKQKVNVEERKRFCEENDIGLTDIISSCFRFKGNANDEFLLVHRYNDVLNYLDKNPSIKKIILTGKSAGSSVHHHFYQYLVQKEVDFEIENVEYKIETVSISYLHGRLSKNNKKKIEIISLPSTSSRSPIKIDRLKQLYSAAFNNLNNG